MRRQQGGDRPKGRRGRVLFLGAMPALAFAGLATWPTHSTRQLPVRTASGAATAPSRESAIHDRPVRVLLVGDSLAWEARTPFTKAVTAGKRATVETEVFGGTALCDFLPGLAAELDRLKPDAVVLEFAGNEFTPCTKDPVTGTPLSRTGLVAKYARDAGAAAVLFRNAGVRVYWADAPPGRWNDRISAQVMNAALRASEAVTPTYPIYAGTAVLKNGTYTETLPCIAGEPCLATEPGTQGLARVRSPDGEHFCPSTTASLYGTIEPCPVYSSGAWRYGRAMAAPLVRDYHL